MKNAKEEIENTLDLSCYCNCHSTCSEFTNIRGIINGQTKILGDNLILLQKDIEKLIYEGTTNRIW